MLAAPLPTVELNPDLAPVAVVVWLHGLGADGHDFEPMVPALRLPADLPVRFWPGWWGRPGRPEKVRVPGT